MPDWRWKQAWTGHLEWKTRAGRRGFRLQESLPGLSAPRERGPLRGCHALRRQTFRGVCALGERQRLRGLHRLLRRPFRGSGALLELKQCLGWSVLFELRSFRGSPAFLERALLPG